MYLNLKKVQELWNSGKPNLPPDSAAVERFKQVYKWVEILQKTKLAIENGTVLIDQIRLNASTLPFGPSRDDLLTDNRDQCLNNIKDQFQGYSEIQSLVKSCWDLLSGTGPNGSIRSEFRIISNTIHGKSDLGSLTSSGPAQKPNSNFTSNNYFFQIIRFLQACQGQQQPDLNSLLDTIPIVLSWPSPSNFGLPESDKGDYDAMFQASKNIMNYRFPLKFLWMWANRNGILPIISLQAMINFCGTDLFQEVRKDLTLTFADSRLQNFISAPFEEFIKDWKAISDCLINALNVPLDQIAELGKLLACVLLEEPEIKSIRELLETGNRAVILYGPPGTGKTYEAMNTARMVITAGLNDEGDTNTELVPFEAKYRFTKLFPAPPKTDTLGAPGPATPIESGCYEIVQFHPGYTYETFIGGILPQLDGDGSALKYVLVSGIFKQFCDAAGANPSKPFIFIIDEINRAELSAVFGELLYSLEYRGEAVHIPHFGAFSIPRNVYIIGTMNNVDKSLVTFDVALRRRFGFYQLRPNLESLCVVPKLSAIQNIDAYSQRCKKLNEAINDELNLGDEYKIGHAYFMKIADFLPVSTGTSDIGTSDEKEKSAISFLELEKLWAYHLEPLLEEYLGLSAAQTKVKKALEKLREDFVKPLE